MAESALQVPTDAIRFPHVWHDLRKSEALLKQVVHPPVCLCRELLQRFGNVNPAFLKFVMDRANRFNRLQNPNPTRKLIIVHADVPQGDAEIV